MYACNQPATFSPAILLLLHLALLISYPSPIPSYPPCSHIYGMVCFLLPFPAACYAHITRLGPRSCCCRLARQTRRREAGSGEGRSRLAWSQSLLPFPSICSPGSPPPLESLPSSRSSLCHFPFSYLPRGDQRGGGGHSICLPAYSPAGDTPWPG